jgi:hypothetical protein
MGIGLMPPSQFDILMKRLDDVSKQIQDVSQTVRNNENKLSHALHGGNGEGEGIYERLRKFLYWKSEHIQTHQLLTVERRSVEEDWRRFLLDTAKQVIAVVVAVVAILVIFMVTGKVVTFP